MYYFGFFLQTNSQANLSECEMNFQPELTCQQMLLCYQVGKFMPAISDGNISKKQSMVKKLSLAACFKG